MEDARVWSMSGCNTPGCEATKAFVGAWAERYQPDMGFIVSNEQLTTDVSIWVSSVPKSEKLILVGQQMNALDPATQIRIKDFLYGKKIFKALVDAVVSAAQLDDGVEVDITGDGEFRAKLGEKASCSVGLLPDELTFSASFWEPSVSAHSISFTVFAADALTVPPAKWQFKDVNEAAQWVLSGLRRSDAASAS